jgi:hypothetical protein
MRIVIALLAVVATGVATAHAASLTGPASPDPIDDRERLDPEVDNGARSNSGPDTDRTNEDERAWWDAANPRGNPWLESSGTRTAWYLFGAISFPVAASINTDAGTTTSPNAVGTSFTLWGFRMHDRITPPIGSMGWDSQLQHLFEGPIHGPWLELTNRQPFTDPTGRAIKWVPQDEIRVGYAVGYTAGSYFRAWGVSAALTVARATYADPQLRPGATAPDVAFAAQGRTLLRRSPQLRLGFWFPGSLVTGGISIALEQGGHSVSLAVALRLSGINADR